MKQTNLFLLFLFATIFFQNNLQAQWRTVPMPDARIQSFGAASEDILFLPGGLENGFLGDVAVYDIDSEEWSSMPLSVPRTMIEAVVHEDRLFTAGGIHFGTNEKFSAIEIYDVNTLEQVGQAELSVPRVEFAAVSVGNKVLFAGGASPDIQGPNLVGFEVHATVDIYDVATDTWSVAALSDARAGMAYAVLGDKVYFAGGDKGNGVVSDVVDIYDAATNTWTTDKLSVGRAFFGGGAAFDNKVYFAGGTTVNSETSDVIDIFEPSTNTWSTDQLSSPRARVRAGTTNEQLLFTGGASSHNLAEWRFLTSSNTVDIYDLEEAGWSVFNMENDRLNHMVLSAKNQVFIMGGLDASGVPLLVPNMLVFDASLPSTDTEIVDSTGMDEASQWILKGSGIDPIAETVQFVNCLSVVDENTVWAVTFPFSGAIKPAFTRTSDGGETWISGTIETGDSTLNTMTVYAKDALTAWVGMSSFPNQNYGKVYKTTDGGITWQEQPVFTTIGTVFHFWSDLEGMATGAVVSGHLEFFRTEDGGVTWQQIEDLGLEQGENNWVNNTNHYYDIVGDNIWTGTTNGRLIKSSDRGKTYKVIEANIAENRALNTLAFQDELNGITVSTTNSDGTPASPLGYRTIDGGETWMPIDVPANLLSIEYVPNSGGVYFGVGSPGAGPDHLISFDSGVTWETFSSPEYIVTTQFLSPSIGWGANPIELGGLHKWEGDPLLFQETAEGALNGGEVSTQNDATSIRVCSGDNVSNIIGLTNNASNDPSIQYTYVMVYDDNRIAGLIPYGLIELEGSPTLNARIYGLAYTGNLTFNQGDDFTTTTLSDGQAILSRNFIDLSIQNGACTSDIDSGFDSKFAQSRNILDLGGMVYLTANGITTAELLPLAKGFVEVFPNPTSNEVSVNISQLSTQEDIEISIVDLLGRNLTRQEVKTKDQETVTMNVSDFRNGLYYINVRSKEGQLINKQAFIIQQ